MKETAYTATVVAAKPLSYKSLSLLRFTCTIDQRRSYVGAKGGVRPSARRKIKTGATLEPPWFGQKLGSIGYVMERYYKKQCLNHSPNIPDSPPLPSNIPGSPPPPSSIPNSAQESEITELDEILANLPADPGLRRQMLDYPLNCREAIPGGSGSDVFTTKGFTNWRKGLENFRVHEGGVGSLHNKAMQQAKDLMIQKQHIETFVIKQTDEARVNYHTLLSGALDCTRWLLRQGLAFRGHDESLKSSNRGNYIELMQFLADHNEKVRKVVFESAPKNLKYTSSDIQKDLVRACTIETINAITKDMEGTFFSLLVDGSRDASNKEQMAVVLRYVNKKGEAIEKFLGVQHVSSTTSSSLEEAIERLFATTNLRQGYDGASNMRGELNGLKTKILNKYPQAFYIHCFAHQLQLALVFVAKENEDVANFFINANRLVNLIGSSCKRRDALREKQQEQIQKALHLGNLETAVVEVVEWIKSDRNQDNLGEATGLFKDIQTFDFVFHLFLMRLILGITNELSQALQKKDQDIVNAMALVEVCKQRLQFLRDDDFGDLLHDVEKFCEEHDIVIPNMEDLHFVPGKSRRKAPKITNFHYYRVDLYFQVLDMQLKELNDRFNEVNTELLLCMACLSPVDNFASFDKEKIVRLAQLYPQDFDRMDLMNLPIQLDNYIQDMKMHSEFSSLRGISDLAKELVKTGRCESYMLVYKLLTLALVLPVATASVERAFSAMKIVKTPLRNKMGDQWLSDSMVVYIERDVFAFIDNEPIMRRFHDMKPRRQQL
ncbi:unnamed protein product [Malus baccata var. baccata]